MEYKFEILGTLPTLNQYVNYERSNRYAASNLKKTTQERIKQCLTDVPVFDKPVEVRFTWIRPNMMTDPDNVAFAKKFILDALQEAGIIQNDSWRYCRPYDMGFFFNKENPRTEVVITDEVRYSFSDKY